MVVLFFSFTLRKLSMYLEFPGNHQGVVLAAQSQKEPSLLVVLLTANVLSGWQVCKRLCEYVLSGCVDVLNIKIVELPGDIDLGTYFEVTFIYLYLEIIVWGHCLEVLCCSQRVSITVVIPFVHSPVSVQYWIIWISLTFIQFTVVCSFCQRTSK